MEIHEDQPQLVTLWSYRDLPEALLAKAKLSSAGIESVLFDSEMIRMNWPISNLIGGIRLTVSAADYDEGLKVLQEPAPDTYSAEEVGSTYTQPSCPRCGSKQVYYENLNRRVTYTSFMLFPGFPIRIPADHFQCEACGHQWQPDANPFDNMPRIVVASSNRGKLKEFMQIAAAAGSDIEVEPVPDVAEISEPEEAGATFEENACIKAIAYSNHIPGALVFADDSGLEVDALGGAPGIRSARFAANNENHKPPDRDNNWKLLQALSEHPTAERTARFVCVIALARDGKIIATFHGEARGEILPAEVGKHGFGYDPLFYVPAANKTFAEMNAQEKATYSHRGAAFRKLLEYLRSS